MFSTTHKVSYEKPSTELTFVSTRSC